MDCLLRKVESEHTLEVLHGLGIVGIFQSQDVNLSLKLASFEVNIACLCESLDEDIVFGINICLSKLEIVVIKFIKRNSG